MDKPIENADEREKLRLVRKILSDRSAETQDAAELHARKIRQDRICRRCRWRRDGVDICVLPRCFKERT